MNRNNLFSICFAVLAVCFFLLSQSTLAMGYRFSMLLLLMALLGYLLIAFFRERKKAAKPKSSYKISNYIPVLFVFLSLLIVVVHFFL